MADLRPKLFIGSSTDGLDVAAKVKSYLQTVCDCFLWTDLDIWEPNDSTFDNLLRMASYFDFGIFVAIADDLTLTGEKMVIEPRDNIILEMALFLGSMGRNKSFLLVEEGIKLPSDFNGIFMPRFKRDDDDTILAACQRYGSKIIEHYQLGHLSLYPTTALAIRYYKNFIAGLVDSISSSASMNIDGTTYTEFKVKVVIPSNLKGSIKEKSTRFYKKHGFVENAIQTKHRRHPSWFQLDPAKAPIAVMYDMPTTLTGLDEAIDLILRKGHVGRTVMQEVIEERELNNFRRVLQIYLDMSPFAQDIVEIVDEF